MTANIQIGSVKIPLLDYAVSCNAILGIRDSGKTVTAKGIAEQLLDHDIPIVVFDAVGKWRWMKVPGPGARGRGYKVVVAGGKAPDLALNSHSVGEIVRSAVKEKIPLIIDLYDPKLSKADWRKIVQESIRIIHYEAVGVAHVFLEEAAEFIPQKPLDMHTYAEVEKLARMGGNASVGITLINQRAQEVNKAVLDLAVNLILGCQVGSKAIEWVGKWLDRLSPETSKAVTTSLPHLKSGEDWVWTRSNLDEPLREQMPMCRSLHPDRRTPEVDLKSAKAVDPEKFVERLRIAIPRIIEEAKAKDPAELTKRINELQREMRRLESAKPQAETKIETKTEIVEKKVVIEGTVTRLEKALSRAEKLRDSFQEAEASLSHEVSQITGLLADARKINAPFQGQPARMQSIAEGVLRGMAKAGAGAVGGAVIGTRSAAPVPRRAAAPSFERAQSNGDISSPMQKILNELAELEAVGISPADKTQLGLFCGYTNIKSGGFTGPLGRLREVGLIHYPGSGEVALTDAGRAQAAATGSPLTTSDLQDRIVNKLDGPRAKVLRQLIKLYPDAIDKETLGGQLGYTNVKSGGFTGPLGSLRKLGLIEYPQSGTVAASELLFPPGLS